MKLHRLPTIKHPPLPLPTRHLYQTLVELTKPYQGLTSITRAELLQTSYLPPHNLDAGITLLTSCHKILRSKDIFAVFLHLRPCLKAEKERNRHRARAATPQDWTLHRRFTEAFPAYRHSETRAGNYCKPSAFLPLLERHHHSHITQRPPAVENIAGPYTAPELQQLITIIAGQESAGRTVHLLYSRKSVSLGILRSPHPTST